MMKKGRGQVRRRDVNGMKKGSEKREGCLYRGNEKERALEG